MTQITFKLAELQPICAHALAAEDHSMGYESDMKKGPALYLVGDQGIYLMSNGKPGLLKEGTESSHIVAYCDGSNPDKDEDWYDFKRAVFGGDDGADTLPWTQAIMNLAEANPKATELVIDMSPTTLAIVGVK